MSTNFIYYNKGALTSKECKFIIDFYEDNEEYHTDGAIGFGEVDHEKKKCKEMYISTDEITPQSEYFSDLCKCLWDNIGKYIEEHPFLTKVTPWILSQNFKIKKYLPKEAYFNTHCEMCGKFNGAVERRMLAWMIYLNDVTEGGETEFPSQEIKFQPRAGDVLIWPSYWTHPHHGLPSPSQIKYILSGWFSYESDNKNSSSSHFVKY